VRMQSGPKGDLWIREDGLTHPWTLLKRKLLFIFTLPFRNARDWFCSSCRFDAPC
jgi:hypothetical protein